MRAATTCALVLALWLIPAATFADDSNPHLMMDANGALDDSACGFCHEDDFTLSRDKVDTCTMCHALNTHAGSAEHLAASPAAVASLVQAEGDVEIPLTDDGALYCGSCHLFHDPEMAGEEWLAEGWVPSTTHGTGKAVRDALTQELSAVGGEGATITWTETGTRALRLPVSDGSLCKRCHGGLLR